MFERIDGEHICLRKAQEKDTLPMLKNVWSDENVYRWMLFQPTFTEEDALDRCQRSILYQKDHFAWFVALQSTGEAIVSCCGIVLPALEAEAEDEAHRLSISRVEDEYYVTIDHEMSRTHYISFIMAAKDNGCEVVKLYPEWNAEARFKRGRVRFVYAYCNRHGLFQVKDVSLRVPGQGTERAES